MHVINILGLSEPTFPRLKRDDIGVSVFPSIQTPTEQHESLSGRDARATRRNVRQITQ